MLTSTFMLATSANGLCLQPVLPGEAGAPSAPQGSCSRGVLGLAEAGLFLCAPPFIGCMLELEAWAPDVGSFPWEQAEGR